MGGVLSGITIFHFRGEGQDLFQFEWGRLVKNFYSLCPPTHIFFLE